MNLTKSIFYTFFASLFLLSCSEESTNMKTESGYDYIIHEKGSGGAVEDDDFIFFSLIVLDDKGNVLQDMSNSPELPSMQLPPADNPARLNNPVFDVFSNANVGDSLTLFMPIDSLKNGGAGLEGVEMISYIIKVVEAKNVAENEAYRLEKQEEQAKLVEEMQLRLPEIESIISSTLANYKSNSIDNILTTDSGLKYVIHEEGTGPMVQAGSQIDAQYYGVLESDGKMFDTSFNRGRAFNFVVGQGQVIKGWDEGFQLLKEGAKATLFIPSDLGYGAAGSPGGIPPAADLVFYVEVEKVN